MDRLTEINKQIEDLKKERSLITQNQCGVEYDGPRAVRETSPMRPQTDEERIHNLFCYHQPEQHHLPMFNKINRAFENAALVVNETVGSFKERELVIEGLSQLRMICNRGIILEGKV